MEAEEELELIEDEEGVPLPETGAEDKRCPLDEEGIDRKQKEETQWFIKLKL